MNPLAEPGTTGSGATPEPATFEHAFESESGDDLESRVRAQGAQIAELKAALDDGRFAGSGTPQSSGVAAALARLGTAPTNWHQATVYFLTSKAEADAPMRKRAPLMFVAGLLMVIVQTATAYAMMSAMSHAACMSNEQCTNMGFFCFVPPDSGNFWSRKGQGRCQMCGELPPLVPYRHETLRVGYGKYADDFKE
eukprot:SAG22_NODE_550_length_9202_cov_30.666484_2_plen_195_part_00